MPAVSICLTTWNRASQLSKTLDSLLAQSFSDFELIVSDDCSSDNTEEVCREYELIDSRVKYYRNQQNLGMPNNLNAAIGRATGQYIANLHDGDIYRADLISKWKSGLDQTQSAAFVFNAYDATQIDGRIYRMPFAKVIPGTIIAEHYFRTLTSCVWGTVMVRASCYDKVGLFDPAWGFISDVDMWLKLSHNNNVVYIDEPLISLAPRPKQHPFRRGLWKSVFWSLGIYVKYLQLYQAVFPSPVSTYYAGYPKLLRANFLSTISYCIRHKLWPQFKEGLGICQDSDDLVLKNLGRFTSRKDWQPEWYDVNWWIMTKPRHSI